MLKSVCVLIYGDVLNYTAVLKLTIICLPQLFTVVMDFSRFQQLQDGERRMPYNEEHRKAVYGKSVGTV